MTNEQANTEDQTQNDYIDRIRAANSREEIDRIVADENKRRSAPDEPSNEGEYIKRSDIDAYIERKFAERDKQHAEEIAKTRALVPAQMVAAHGGGPGVNNHQRSWSLVEQEHAARGGEPLEHWEL